MANESGDAVRHGVGSESARYRALIELAALDKSDFAAVLRTILATDARELDVERVNCWSVEEGAIRCVTGYIRGADRFEDGTVLEESMCPSYFRALADDPIILADEARTDARTREFTDSYLAPLGITSMMDVPILGARPALGRRVSRACRPGTAVDGARARLRDQHRAHRLDGRRGERTRSRGTNRAVQRILYRRAEP